MARSSVRRLLEREGFDVCGEAADANATVECAARERPDICVLDVLLPGETMEAIREISRHSETEVVVFTGSQSQALFFEALRAGAAGYLLKDMNPDRLPDAIRGVVAGEAAIPRTLVASLLSELRSDGRKRRLVGRSGPVELSAREWQAADLLAAGMHTGEIAARLEVAQVTVRLHISQIVRKLGASGREEAIELLVESGGFDEPQHEPNRGRA
jgi:DNA-binding NarL/FixJ family response regulator